jgi:hypothetical protein
MEKGAAEKEIKSTEMSFNRKLLFKAHHAHKYTFAIVFVL